MMVIASTAYLLHNKYTTKGGRTRMVSLVRVVRNLKAKKDTFGLVYREDGTYHYPKSANNILRKNGEFYFTPIEITGSSEETEKNPKFRLLCFFIDIEIPQLNCFVNRSTHYL